VTVIVDRERRTVRAEPFDLAHWSGTSHEHIAFAFDPGTNLRAVFAIHSTALGPALGGTRWYPFLTTAEAVTDVLRLSEAMSYKAAAAGLALGGGKAVIIGDPTEQRSDELLEAYGRMIDQLGGRYITAEDVGTTVEDMEVIRRVTPHVTGLPIEAGGSGDPSPATARGVRSAIRATAAHLWGSEDLTGRRVVVAGVGKVGSVLVGHLVDDGCEVVVADIDEAATRAVASRHAVEVVDVAHALTTPCDILSPAALGGILNQRSIASLRCQAVVGAANNQLADPGVDASTLRERGIVYVPDFVVNAGGLINIAEEIRGYDAPRAAAAVERVGESVRHVLELANERSIDTHRAAVRFAQARMNAAQRTMSVA
jgi:valine dehydrogenase (NAD+)